MEQSGAVQKIHTLPHSSTLLHTVQHLYTLSVEQVWYPRLKLLFYVNLTCITYMLLGKSQNTKKWAKKITYGRMFVASIKISIFPCLILYQTKNRQNG